METLKQTDKKAIHGLFHNPYTLPILSALLFLSVFSTSASPLYPFHYNYSSSFFSVMGRAIAQGHTPYIDLCDINGPVFFLWQAIWQSIAAGRIGVFISESILLIVSVIYISKLCRLFSLRGASVTYVFFIFYLVYAAALFGGNTTEEFALPFCLACLYYSLDCMLKETGSTRIAFLFGIALSCIVFTNPAAGAPLYAALISVVIHMLTHKKLRRLCISFLFFMAGVLTVTVPLFIYLYQNDALDGMLYYSFRLAFVRALDTGVASASSLAFAKKWELFMLPCYLGLAISYLIYKRPSGDKSDFDSSICSLILTLSLTTCICLHLGGRLQYYLGTILPLIIFEGLYFLRMLSSFCKDAPASAEDFRASLRRLLLISFIFIISIAIYYPEVFSGLHDDLSIITGEKDKNDLAQMQSLLEEIPEGERNDIACEGYGIKFFDANRILPANKYPYNGPYLGSLSPAIEQEIENEVISGRHKWLYAEYSEYSTGSFVQLIHEHYELVAEYGMMQLYRYKG